MSFLGKGVADKKTGYRTARYDFGADCIREVPYFGLALAEHGKPRRLVLVGTAGSMWDIFFERHGAQDDELMTLIDAVAEQRVTEDMLSAHEQRLAQKLGMPVHCLLISYARDTREQVAILSQLAGAVRKNETVTLDVTHAFRHLPMLALVAARYLAHVAGVKIEGIYYGALEMTPPGGATPVLRLDGMLSMLDWVEALATQGWRLRRLRAAARRRRHARQQGQPACKGRLLRAQQQSGPRREKKSPRPKKR
ncbi:MAG: TIGR02221 family CRISPR-associated protein [Rhodocyclaceae bacterium]|nr:TIGR02221 family CRISPR-associated protein [Rhodocyclaceae bacterium]